MALGLDSLVVRPPRIYRAMFPGGVFTLPAEHGKSVYLTFDDGPIPEVTPELLAMLADHGVVATFFMVGDNVRKHPDVFRMVVEAGHATGNHTMHHMQGIKADVRSYMADVEEADGYIRSRLFRPPHGLMRPGQVKAVGERYRMVMYDIVTRDYCADVSPENIFGNVSANVRNGSIIAMHDSLKSWPRLKMALPRIINHLKDEGYEFKKIEL